MGATTEIAWCDATFNPWMGCVKVSPACANCYGERDTKRWGKELWGSAASRQVTSDTYWKQPIRWNREAREAGVRRRVFCASLADVFEERPDLEGPRERLYQLVESTPNLDWLLLTKRIEAVARIPGGLEIVARENVWLGTTVEDQQRANERISHLLALPARVRFLSLEPLLGRVVLQDEWLERLSWMIVGGESGSNARPMHPDWARSLRYQAHAFGVPFFR